MAAYLGGNAVVASRLGGLAATLNAGGGASKRLRSVPVSADMFYIVAKNSVGSADAIRFQRNIGAAADGNNFGVKWPEWRVTGRYRLASFDTAPTSPDRTFSSDTGAHDMVANVSGGRFAGSYHGLGASGALNSETLTADGAAFDHTVAASFDAFELRNSTTANDGSANFTRDLSLTINAAGGVHYKINGTPTMSGMSFLYVGMPIATGANYKEADARAGTAFNTLALGSGDARAYLGAGEREVRLRDTVNGNQIIGVASFPDLAGYTRAEVIRNASESRTKVYLGRFTSAAALANAEFDINVAVGATGEQFAAANLLTNTVFTTGWAAVSTGGTNSVSAGVLTQTTTVNPSDLRYHTVIPTVAVGGKYASVIDVTTSGSLGVSAGFAATSNVNGSKGTPAPAFLQSVRLGRNIQTWVATQADPNQRFMALMASPVVGDVAQFSSPAAYALAA